MCVIIDRVEGDLANSFSQIYLTVVRVEKVSLFCFFMSDLTEACQLYMCLSAGFYTRAITQTNIHMPISTLMLSKYIFLIIVL